MFDRSESTAGRMAGAIDLLVDFATLGEYGLEPLTADADCCADGRCEFDGRRTTAWEALATPRRGACHPPRVDFAGAVARFARR